MIKAALQVTIYQGFRSGNPRAVATNRIPGSRPGAWACLHTRITTTPSSSHTRDPLESAAEGLKADANPIQAVSTRHFLKNIYSHAEEFVNHVTHNKACNASFTTNITSNFSSKLMSDSKNPLSQRVYISLFTSRGKKKHINNQGTKCRVGTAFSNTHNKTVLKKTFSKKPLTGNMGPYLRREVGSCTFQK